MIEEVMTLTEIMHTKTDNGSESNTKDHPMGFCTLSYKSQNNPYQREFLSYVEGFVNKSDTNANLSALSPKTQLKGWDGLLPRTDATQIKEAKKGPNHKDILPMAEEVQFHIEEDSDFII